MRIEFNNREKELIHEYWYMASKDMQTQLLNKRRKTLDITREELENLVGYLSMECNHCKSNRLAFELNELCERLECWL